MKLIEAPDIDIIKRDEWDAKKPYKKLRRYTEAAKYIIFASTGSETCSRIMHCIPILQKLQEKHIERGRSDIIYNFMINNKGCIFEGRGWSTIPSVNHHYQQTIGKKVLVGFIGEFLEKLPPSKMLGGAALLINEGIRKHKIQPNFIRLPFHFVKRDPLDLDIVFEDESDDDWEV